MRFIKVQNKVINFDRVTSFYADKQHLIVETEDRCYTFVYGALPGAETALQDIITILMKFSGSYTGEVK